MSTTGGSGFFSGLGLNVVQSEILSAQSTSSTTFVSAGTSLGLAAAITPENTGRVLIFLQVGMTNNTAGDGCAVDVFWVPQGTSVPAAGSSAFVGIAGSPLGIAGQLVSVTANAFAVMTTVWLDITTGTKPRTYYLGVKAITGGTAQAGLLAGSYANWLLIEV